MVRMSSAMSLHRPRFFFRYIKGLSWQCQPCNCGNPSSLPSLLQQRCMSRARKKLERKQAQHEEVLQFVGENAKRADRVYVWGCAATGALGISSYLRTENSGQKVLLQMRRPARLRFIDENRLEVKNVDCGYGFTLMICKIPGKGLQLYGTGINTDSQLGLHEYPQNSGRILDYIIQPVPVKLPLQTPDSTKLLSVAGGRAHTLVLTDKEGVFSLGNNAYGQCGRPIVEGEFYRGSDIIHRIRDLPNNIVQIVCGQDHSFFVTDSGEVYSCGLGADGQTGLEHYKLTHQPSLVKGDIQGEQITQVSSSSDCVLAISDKGDVFGWGNSEYHQFGSITEETQVSVPRHVDTKHCGKVIQVAAAGSKCAVLNEHGQVYVWGFGILGKGPKLSSASVPEMIPETLFGSNEITPDSHVTSIKAGVNHFIAISNKYDIYSWGKNTRGCLGLQSAKDQYFPLKIAMPAETHAVACGVDHNVALCKSWC